MILVFLGTQDTPFERLLIELDKLIDEKKIKQKVIAQIGTTKYESKNIKTFDFIIKEKMNELIEEADLIITHGGVGTITDCIKKEKKVIVVPRYKKYGEHTNDHQYQITKEFSEKGYIIPSYEVCDLLSAIKKSNKFIPAKYKSNNNNFKRKLKEYIESI